LKGDDHPIDKLAIATGDYRIQQMHPLAYMSLAQAFPWFCCCVGKKKKDLTEEEEEAKENAISVIKIGNARLNELIKFLKGNYKGRGFTGDAKVAAGITKK
jgi:hypothetical protein